MADLSDAAGDLLRSPAQEMFSSALGVGERLEIVVDTARAAAPGVANDTSGGTSHGSAIQIVIRHLGAQNVGSRSDDDDESTGKKKLRWLRSAIRGCPNCCHSCLMGFIHLCDQWRLSEDMNVTMQQGRALRQPFVV